MKRYCYLIVLMASVMVWSATAAELHVSPRGNDATGDGSLEKPFATLVTARDAARQTAGPDTILLAPGRYYNEGTIVLDDRDSGLTIKGEQPGAVAEVYGGVPVTGWEKWKGGIWRAKIVDATPSSRQKQESGGGAASTVKRFYNLIVDGHPATMAQTPNLGSGYGGGVAFANTGIVVPAAWRNYDFSDAQVACFIGTCWFNEMRAVLADKPDAKGHLPIHPGCGGNFKGLNRGMSVVRGVLELLDEPGEWCLKHKEGYVYYWPALRSLGEGGQASGTPMDHTIVRPVSEKLIEVHGRAPETPAKNITLRNLSLIGSDFCATWELFKNAYGPDCNTLNAAARQGLVFGENVEGLKVSGCRILAAGHSGVFLNHYAQGCVVEDCLIAQAGVSAVYLHGWQVGAGPFKTIEESYVNKNNKIENCFMYDCGVFLPTSAAISTYQSGDLLVARNEIAEQARCGFMVNGVRWGVMQKKQYGKTLGFKDYFDANHNRRVRVIGNDIYNVCRNTDDFGAIEAWGTGRDNQWENNVVHDLEHCQKWDTWGHAIFPDDSDHYMTVRGNIVHHFYGGRATRAIMVKNIEQMVENNLVVDCGINSAVTFSPFMEPSWEMTIRHNIFASTGESGFAYGDMNNYCLTGKPFLDATVPAGAKGMREVDHNWIVPKDPSHPNPLAEKYHVDLHSTFAPEPVRRLKSDWDIQAGDYEITPKPSWWQPIDCSQIGLRKDFPFDKLAATRRGVGEKIQAERYQRRHELRASGGSGIYALSKGSWAKYDNIDFGNGAVTKAVFELLAAPVGAAAPKPFIRAYGSETVEEIPFKGDRSVETIPCWEISKPFTKAGKTGSELFDEPFVEAAPSPLSVPQRDGGVASTKDSSRNSVEAAPSPLAVPQRDASVVSTAEWSPYLRPVTSKLGITTAPGVVDFFVANSEEVENACAYARASIWAQGGRQNATMTISSAGGAKVWLNGQLVISTNQSGTASETPKCTLKAGWNTILVKVTQGVKPSDFNFKLGMVASSCGHIVSLPGLPTEQRAEISNKNNLVELRLDSPKDGQLIGALAAGQTECRITNARGIHNLYLVFPGTAVKSMDWFRLEK